MEFSDYRGIQDLQTIPRLLLQGVVKHGDSVIDGTAGRGRDTLYLAELVGPGGCVYAFDIQEDAIKSTQNLLSDHDLMERVMLIQDCHSNIPIYIHEGVKAAVFNLGYLPGSDHKVITRPESTLDALAKSLTLLTVKGITLITLYTGHQGGDNESVLLKKYCCALPKKDFSVFQGIYLNQSESSPYWIAIQKNREDTQ